ncbi:MAG: hypothetical protein RI924_835 [Bacteroidota bacterium]|jgi:undecaprenyl-diphosphatase
MIEQLIQLDHQWFLAVNKGLSNPFFDYLMPILRNRYTWIPLYVLIIYLLIKNFGKTAWFMLLALVLCFGIADYTSSSIIKPAVERLRPCNEIPFSDQLTLRIPCGRGYSFPSSHAANHFAIALFLIVLFRKNRAWLMPLALLWAASISFAQVYVGVHFPVDVTAGALLGSSIGYLIAFLFLRLKPEHTWKSGK